MVNEAVGKFKVYSLHNVEVNAERIWFGQDPLARLVRGVLWPLSLLYGLGWRTYLMVYRFGIKRAYQARIPIVVVGNFTVGGSGKTPATLAIVRLLRSAGIDCVVGCSGYGSVAQHGAKLMPSSSDSECLDATEWGDEALVFRYFEPELPIVVGRDRVRAAQLVEQSYPNAVLVMDDGLQHLRLASDCTIVLTPQPDPNRNLLPAGPYREPYDSKRIHLEVPTQAKLIRAFSGFWESNLGQVLMDPPKGTQVQVLTAIARWDRFVESVESLGLKPKLVVPLPDHDPLTGGTLFSRFEPDLPIVVTVKDWVKLRTRSDLRAFTFWVAREEPQFEPEGFILERLNEKIQEASKKVAGE